MSGFSKEVRDASQDPSFGPDRKREAAGDRRTPVPSRSSVEGSRTAERKQVADASFGPRSLNAVETLVPSGCCSFVPLLHSGSPAAARRSGADSEPVPGVPSPIACRAPSPMLAVSAVRRPKLDLC